MNQFVLIALLIAGILTIFLGFRLTGLGYGSWLVSVISIALILLYPLIWYEVLPKSFAIILRQITHLSIAWVSFLIGLVILRDMFFFPISFLDANLSKFAYSAFGTYILIFIAVLMLIYGYWNASREPKLVEVEIPIVNLPSALEGLTLIQISDLHAGPSVNKKFIDKLVERIVALKPSAFMLTGDIADGKFSEFKNTVESLAKLASQAPVFYVTGNHEYLKDSEAWIKHFKELGLTVLLNEHFIMELKEHKILIAGIIDPEATKLDQNEAPSISDAISGAPQCDLKILLAHRPDVAEKASNSKFAI